MPFLDKIGWQICRLATASLLVVLPATTGWASGVDTPKPCSRQSTRQEKIDIGWTNSDSSPGDPTHNASKDGNSTAPLGTSRDDGYPNTTYTYSTGASATSSFCPTL